MKTRFFNYLRFNRAERNGTLALMLLAVLLFAIPEITRHFRGVQSTDFVPFQHEIQALRIALEHPEQASGKSTGALFKFDPNTASLEDFVQLGLSEKVAKVICNYRDKGGNFREPADLQKIWSLKKEDYTRLLPFIRIGSATETPHEKVPEKPIAALFAFDPNTITEAELFQLGLPSRTVKSILNYRSKGGQFRKREDLEKIYTLSEEDCARIAPYATFSAAIAATPTRPVAYAGACFTPAKENGKGPVDINRASLQAWMTLPGIGETRARQLVGFREKLGGFVTVEQVAEMFELPDSIYQRMRPNLILSTAEIRKINLNAASVADLDLHPYISKRQAEIIVAYREQHGAFASPEDLSKMRAFSDQAWLAKVKPYLGVE